MAVLGMVESSLATFALEHHPFIPVAPEKFAARAEFIDQPNNRRLADVAVI